MTRSKKSSAPSPSRIEMAILPSPLLVRIATAVALLAMLALPLPILIAPVLTMLAIVVALAIADWLSARHEVVPSLTRVIPNHMVKGRAATIQYRLARLSGGATVISVLDELP